MDGCISILPIPYLPNSCSPIPCSPIPYSPIPCLPVLGHGNKDPGNLSSL